MRRWRPSPGPDALLLLALAACAGGATRPSPAPAPAAANPAPVLAGYAELMRMADARTVDSALIARLLVTGSSPVRAEAALAAGQLHAAALAPRLRTLLADPDTAVASHAAFALGLLADSAGVDALASLAARRIGPSADAAWALGAVGEPARGALVRLLGSLSPETAAPGPADSTAGALLLAAARLRPVPVDAVLPYLRHPDAAVRWRAAYAIARPGVPAGLRALAPLAADADALVRSQVATALRRSVAGDSLADTASSTLRLLVRDGDPHVRINAVRSLATYGPPARDALLAATADPDANVRIAAAQALGAVLDSGPAPWLAAWQADTGFMYRRSLLASAAHAGVTLPAADPADPASWLRSPRWRERASAAEAAGEARSAAAVQRALAPLLADSDGRVRAAAIGALAALADSAAAPVVRPRLLAAAVSDPDPYVRATAIGALTRRASAAGLPAIARAYGVALGDSVPDARIAAVRYIAAAWRRDSAGIPDSLRAAIASLPAPTEALVREQANVSLLRGWPAVAGTARPLAWYEDRVATLVVPALAGRLPHAVLLTERGPITLELFAADAPLTADNFMTLARRGFFDGGHFHRVVPNFVAQDGDPQGDGNGGPPYTIRDELNPRRYVRGAVGMALSGPDTGGSQYFLTLSPQPHLDGGYTVFARVVGGFEAMDALVQGDSIISIRIP